MCPYSCCTKCPTVSIKRRERGSERWQALGVGPQRKVRNADKMFRFVNGTERKCRRK